ncbi:MAG: hypothetical protein WBA77_12345 [Microcoleaceae cyanobacterium]
MGDVSHAQLKRVLQVGQQQPGLKMMLPISSQVKWKAKYSLQRIAKIIQVNFTSFGLHYTPNITQIITFFAIRDSLTYLEIEIQYLLIGDTS